MMRMLQLGSGSMDRKLAVVVLLLAAAMCVLQDAALAEGDEPALSYGRSRYLLTNRRSDNDLSCKHDHDVCKYLPHQRRFEQAKCCDGKCVDVARDENNCGKCDKECKDGTACCKGKCRRLFGSDRSNCSACGSKCRDGEDCCQGQCKSVHGSDRSNCGGCGKKCKYGAVCCKGDCKSVHGHDSSNCGACGKVCARGVKCLYGICGYNDKN